MLTTPNQIGWTARGQDPPPDAEARASRVTFLSGSFRQGCLPNNYPVPRVMTITYSLMHKKWSGKQPCFRLDGLSVFLLYDTPLVCR